MMTSSRRKCLALEFEHCDSVLERRRSLFPGPNTDETEADELGHISPLTSTSDSEDSVEELLPKIDRLECYDIIGVIDNVDIATPSTNGRHTHSEDTMSPLFLSPTITSEKTVNQTPSRYCPSQNLKTPHDSSSKNNNFPRLTRKSFTEENISEKRKHSPSSSPEFINKCQKVESSSKVRTALFPQEMSISVPVKKFYSNDDENFLEKLLARKQKNPKPLPLFHSKVSHKVNRRFKEKINNGVGHKVRKPKQQSIRRDVLHKANQKIMQTDSAITEYIQDMSEMKKNQKMVVQNSIIPANNINTSINTIPRLIQPALDENKENVHTYNTKKRTNEDEVETNTNKKFFKSSTSRGIVTVHKNLKLAVDLGTMSLISGTNKTPKMVPKIDVDPSDFFDESEDIAKPDIDGLICTLNTDSSPEKHIVLEAHSSISASENSIQLHQQPNNMENLILSPISQMCNVTSGLVLSSPKKARNLSTVLEAIPSTSHDPNSTVDTDTMDQQKLFPIFCGGAKSIAQKEKKPMPALRSAKKIKLSNDQMLLDAGQKNFGAQHCLECGIVYHIGNPADEAMHANYHDSVHVLKFSGWKNEHILANISPAERIIRILPTDSKIWLKKVTDLMKVINKELGCYEMHFEIQNSQVYLYIKNKTIAGCIVAVAKQEAYKMLTTDPSQPDMCSQESYPIVCGISRIWVSQRFRKQGIATALMNSVKNNFMFSHILKDSDIAISAPTENGKLFAVSYFKTKNYLIYFP